MLNCKCVSKIVYLNICLICWR